MDYRQAESVQDANSRVCGGVTPLPALSLGPIGLGERCPVQSVLGENMATSPVERVVLLAADNSKHSVNAFHFYASHFHKAEDRLVVVNTPECVVNPTDSSTQGIEVAIMETKAKTEVIKNKFVNLMSEAGMTGEFVALEDKHPGHAIVRHAETVGAAFIVTGSRGLSKFRRTMLGSVSDYIMHHSHVPVLVCRHKATKD